jgi:hypothetical protein
MKTIEINGNEIAINSIAVVTKMETQQDAYISYSWFKVICNGYEERVSYEGQVGHSIADVERNKRGIDDLIARRNEIIKLWKEK